MAGLCYFRVLLQWEIEAFAERYSVAPKDVVGMRRAVVDGRITSEIEPPCSWGDGKLDAYNLFVNGERPPNFVAGDSIGDWKVAGMGDGLRGSLSNRTMSLCGMRVCEISLCGISLLAKIG